jgi:uncharacterized membrane protein
MTRLNIIDNARGVAFILMVIHHIFYFYDVNNKYMTSLAHNEIIDNVGFIARHIFLFLTGYSLATNYSEKKYKNKINFIYDRLKKSLLILAHAFAVSIITYNFYPNYYIRFGVLHFIGIITLLLSIIAPYKSLYPIIFLFSLYLKNNIDQIPHYNSIIDTMLGTNITYNMIDYFPLIKFTPVVLLGMIATFINKDIFQNMEIFNHHNILTDIGTDTLNLYTLHIVGLILFYVKFYSK